MQVSRPFLSSDCTDSAVAESSAELEAIVDAAETEAMVAEQIVSVAVATTAVTGTDLAPVATEEVAVVVVIETMAEAVETAEASEAQELRMRTSSKMSTSSKTTPKPKMLLSKNMTKRSMNSKKPRLKKNRPKPSQLSMKSRRPTAPTSIKMMTLNKATISIVINRRIAASAGTIGIVVDAEATEEEDTVRIAVAVVTGATTAVAIVKKVATEVSLLTTSTS